MSQTDLLRKTSAGFSDCRMYRYWLSRTWGDGPPCVFVMLNPSTADEDVNDPTVERCERFARRWGYQGLLVVNLFAWRATDPSALLTAPDPVGPCNDAAIANATADGRLVVCAWGNHGQLQGRAERVVRMLDGRDLMCFGRNQSGQPVHPLYQRSDAELIPFPVGGSDGDE